MKAQFLISAPTSGSGKTTLSRGLMALYSSKGYKVQPFKCGPDYIDTKFHSSVCGRPSVNLDTFMAHKNHVKELYYHYSKDCDISIVEGMMGLFDGYDRDLGSSAEIAATLNLPVILVVDAKSSAYSVAALLSGFLHFRDDVHITGVIFNKVGSERHEKMLREVCTDLRITCLGCLLKDPVFEQGNRYLGLDFSEQNDIKSQTVLIERQIDYDRIIDLCKNTSQNEISKEPFTKNADHVLMARNSESFSFIYQETIDKYENVSFFDPETEIPCFDGIDLLYLPGGYPEKHLEALVSSAETRNAIKEFASRGGRIIAECGGMMYLCRSILTDDGEYPMCGVFEYCVSACKADKKLSLGYRRFELDGIEYRGHEFHYTQFVGNGPISITQVYNAKGNPVPTPIFRYKNVLASYTHLYPL